MAPTVVVVPQSGYINRLQAIASAAVLADELETDWCVVWRPSSVAPATATQVFDTSFVGRRFRSEHEISESYGVDFDHIPLYLSEDRNNAVLYLRGHDRGEQAFMEDLRARLRGRPSLRCLVIVAGGKFDLLSPERSAEAVARRRDFYRRLRFVPAIEERVESLTQGRSPFVGLHLRYTDRSLDSPSRKAISQAVVHLAVTEETSHIFVAADSLTARDLWTTRLRSCGLEPWFQNLASIDRASEAAVVDAITDWRILTRARAVAYFRESSFGEEAAVASGAFGASVGIRASRGRLFGNRARNHWANLVTYPRRHWLS